MWKITADTRIIPVLILVVLLTSRVPLHWPVLFEVPHSVCSDYYHHSVFMRDLDCHMSTAEAFPHYVTTSRSSHSVVRGCALLARQCPWTGLGVFIALNPWLEWRTGPSNFWPWDLHTDSIHPSAFPHIVPINSRQGSLFQILSFHARKESIS